MSTDARPAVFRANDGVWAALRPGDVTSVWVSPLKKLKARAGGRGRWT